MKVRGFEVGLGLGLETVQQLGLTQETAAERWSDTGVEGES